MTYPETHPSYQKVEKILKLYIEKYGEPWERRGPLIQDILNGVTFFIITLHQLNQ